MDDERYPSLHPPAYGYHADADNVTTPDLVLMEEFAYFADRDNATTATCEMRGPNLKGSIKVTFCPVRPPLVSYFCVHATAFDHTDFAIEPRILATETNGGLVLLCVIIGDTSAVFQYGSREYLIYDSGTERRRPSLKYLPHPGGNYVINEGTFAIVRECRHAAANNDHFTLHPSGNDFRGRSLRRHGTRGDGSGFTLRPHGASQEDHDCGDCNYVIVAQPCGFGYLSPNELCLYHSETETWNTKPVLVQSYPRHLTSKAITIGGDDGTVAWVDLWRNIIFCDVLAKSPKLHVVCLPPPITPSEELGSGDPRSVRDVAVLDGFIQYIELHCRIVPGLLIDGLCTFDGWKAAKWSIKVTSSLAEAWHRDYELDSSEISESLPKLQVDADTTDQPTWQRLHIGLPKLSLQDDGIVYFLTEIDYPDNEQTAWVLAVDMRSKTIQQVAEYSAKRTIGVGRGYNASRISKYLKGVPVTKQQQKRQGMPLLRSSSKKRPGISMATDSGVAEVEGGSTETEGDYMALE